MMPTYMQTPQTNYKYLACCTTPVYQSKTGSRFMDLDINSLLVNETEAKLQPFVISKI